MHERAERHPARGSSWALGERAACFERTGRGSDLACLALLVSVSGAANLQGVLRLARGERSAAWRHRASSGSKT